jgi:uncharacterized repeat protein (TIGR01451 family)
MFNRLISNLPFNPSLIGQVAFYAKRLSKENSIRRLGFVFMALTLFVQLFAVIAPPQPSLAASGNDIIRGGFSSKDEGVAKCNANEDGYATILNYFGVSCQDLAGGTARQIDYSEYNGQLRSVGRYPYGFAGEQAHYVGSVGTIYSRPLTSWGAHCYNDGKGCQAIVGNSSRGVFMVLFSCGNLVFINLPPPPPTKVKTVQCANLIMNVTPGSKVPVNTTIGVRGQANGQNLPADELTDMYYDYVNVDTGVVQGTTQALGVPFGGAGSSTATDPAMRTFKLTKAGHYRFRLSVKYYDGGAKDATGNQTGDCAKDVFVNTEPTPEVCPYNPNLPKNSPDCKPCDKSQDTNDSTACLILSKTAKNETQNVSNADGTIANAGDTITYTLSVRNTGKATVKKFVIEENMGDVLDYADIVNLHGGVKDGNNIVRWPASDIKAGETLSKEITVRIKNPIPQTPISASNPGSFNMILTNVYGNTVNIKLPPTVVKTTEQITKTLPNTGPGTNLIIAFVITTIIGYFFARSRLLTNELEVIRSEYGAGA